MSSIRLALHLIMIIWRHCSYQKHADSKQNQTIYKTNTKTVNIKTHR